MIAGNWRQGFKALAFACLAVFTLSALPSLAQDLENERAVSEARFDEAYETFTSNDALQKERPVKPPEPIELQPARGGFRGSFSFIGPIFEVIGYILVALVAAGVLFALFLMFSDMSLGRSKQKEKDPDDDISIIDNLRPEERRARALLEDADALAAKGMFAEAVHLLLFRSIDEIQEKKGAVARSLTAREIGSLGFLTKDIRDALSPIIRIVERSFFGGRPVNENSWQEARASYENFAFGGAWT